MSLQCGIVGLPNVGKSTIFNCLSNTKAQSANFPFCTIEPNTGVITVPDERLNVLEDLVKPQQVIPTTIEIVDIAGLVKGASKGEGLGNQFLGNIRSTDAIIHVLRCFEDTNITHVEETVDPIRDKEIIDTELQLKDLESLEKKYIKYQKQAKVGDKEAVKILSVLDKFKAHLEAGNSIRSAQVEDKDWEYVQDLQLLTSKPVIYVCNVDEDAIVSGNTLSEKVKVMADSEGAEVMIICAAVEEEIATLDTYEERMEFLNDYGLQESGLNKLIRSSYKMLNLITYFTAGEKEVRAWTIQVGTKAPGAAGVIHTDFERGFIKADVIGYGDFKEQGSEAACREAGKLRQEGKEYVVSDGDVMHFKFNV